MNIPLNTADVILPSDSCPRGTLPQGDDGWGGHQWRTTLDADKRTTMPRGAYRFGASNPRLRPNVPEGE